MNRSVLAVCGLLFVCVLVIYSCGGSMSNPLQQGSPALSVTVTDTPPAGVSVLSFEVSVTGATLNPGSVDLLAGRGPVRIEVENLETESAFLSTASVAPGTYTSLNLTFANPELTFKNGTATALAGCAPGAVCEIKPAGTLTSMVNFPSPGLLIEGTPSGGMMGEDMGGDDEQTAMGIKLDLDVEVDAMMMPGGIFLAKKIEFEDNGEDDELEGVVFKIDDAMHFEMVVLDELRSVNNVNVGNPVIVTLSNPSFRVQMEDLNAP